MDSAMLVMPGEDMPICEENNAGQLIYVKDDSEFYYCDSGLGWVVINLKGQDGRSGKDGTSGVNGRDGLAGRDGRDGQNGQDAEILSRDKWTDPITGNSFVLVNATLAQIAASYPCPTGTSKPAISEVWGAYWYFETSFVYDVNSYKDTLYFADSQGYGTANHRIYSSSFTSAAGKPFICKIN